MILTITIADEHAQEVLDAFARQHDYRPKVAVSDPKNPGKLVVIDNPETPQAFVERLLKEHVARTVQSHRQKQIAMPAVAL